MKNQKLFKSAIITGVIGLIIIFSIILSNSAYPDMLFRILTPLGLLFVFVSIVLGFVSWLWYIMDTIRKKEYVMAIIIAVLGLLVIIKAVVRSL